MCQDRLSGYVPPHFGAALLVALFGASIPMLGSYIIYHVQRIHQYGLRLDAVVIDRFISISSLYLFHNRLPLQGCQPPVDS